MFNKAENNCIQLFPDLNNMLVWVIKADNSLAPTVFIQFVNIAYIKGFQMIAEGIHIIFFKIEFPRVVGQSDIIHTDK